MTEQAKRLQVDRVALAKSLALGRRANAEWCVACGASKGASPELPRIVEQQIGQDPEILKQLTRADFVRGLAERLSGADLNADWCVACGAESGVTPEQLVSNPVPLTDEMIDELARRLVEK